MSLLTKESFGVLQSVKIRMGQQSKNKTVFKLPVEITFLYYTVYLLLRCIVFIALGKIPERERSISPSNFYGQLPNYQSQVLSLSTN